MAIITDGLRSYGAALNEIGATDRQEAAKWLNNRVENSHQPLRRRERAMTRFRGTKTLKQLSAVHASVGNHFSHERHLINREIYKERRSEAYSEWRSVPD